MARFAIIHLLGGGLLEPALGNDALAASHAAAEDEQAITRVIAGGGLDAAAGDFSARAGQ